MGWSGYDGGSIPHGCICACGYAVCLQVVYGTGATFPYQASAPCGWAHSLPTYANGYKQAVLKTYEPKGLWVRILPLAFMEYWRNGIAAAC